MTTGNHLSYTRRARTTVRLPYYTPTQLTHDQTGNITSLRSRKYEDGIILLDYNKLRTKSSPNEHTISTTLPTKHTGLLPAGITAVTRPKNTIRKYQTTYNTRHRQAIRKLATEKRNGLKQKTKNATACSSSIHGNDYHNIRLHPR